jgi:hypothetical protein
MIANLRVVSHRGVFTVFALATAIALGPWIGTPSQASAGDFCTGQPDSTPCDDDGNECTSDTCLAETCVHETGACSIFGAPFLFVHRWWIFDPGRQDAVGLGGALFASLAVLLAIAGPQLRGNVGATASFVGFSMWGICVIGVASGGY